MSVPDHVLFGLIFGKIRGPLKNLPEIYATVSLKKATKLAFKKATISNLKNYVILFSPSAASFDQYNNFEDRGNKFKEIVNQQLNEGLIK